MKKSGSKNKTISLKKIVYCIVLIFLCVYGFFLIDGFLPIGSNLNKSDWLMFLGTYLAFSGTIIVSFVAYKQNNDLQNERADEEYRNRLNEINPIFVIEPYDNNDELFALSYKVTNIGKYPAINVFVNKEQFFSYLQPMQEIVVNYYTLEENVEDFEIQFDNVDGITQINNYQLDLVFNHHCYCLKNTFVS